MLDFLNPLTWDWTTFLKTFLGAGLGTAAVQAGWAYYQDVNIKSANAAYLALRVAVMLEAYASACSDFYFENAHAQHLPDEEFPDWSVILPTLPHYPEDDDGWRAMDRALVARCLNFPNKIHGSQGLIRATIEFTMGDGLIDVLEEQAASRGKEAWEIAASLRATYKLQEAETVFDVADALTTAQQASKAKRELNQFAHTAKFSED